MIVCPVCEHTQARGAECEACGKELASGAATVIAVPAVEGLERALHAEVVAPAERLAGLEPTRHPDGAFVPETVQDFETGRAGPIDVDAPPIPDIERTDAGIPDDGPTALAAIVTCRYCRTPAAFGERICGRCGMRLPVLDEAASEAPADEPRLCSCGTPLRGASCPSCGARTR